MAPCWTVYCHIHIVTGRRYVGLTKKRMLQRWNEHVYNAERKQGRNCRHFWAAIRKYGKDAFSHEVLETCPTLEAANSAEERWIRHFDTRNPKMGFNLDKGGNHTPHPVKNPWDRPEYRERCMKILLARNTDPEVRAAISSKLAGRTLSSEHARKTREIVASRQMELSIAGNAARRARPKSCCKHGHSLHDAFVKLRDGKIHRSCRTCDKDRSAIRRQDPKFKERQQVYNKRRSPP